MYFIFSFIEYYDVLIHVFHYSEIGFSSYLEQMPHLSYIIALSWSWIKYDKSYFDINIDLGGPDQEVREDLSFWQIIAINECHCFRCPCCWCKRIVCVLYYNGLDIRMVICNISFQQKRPSTLYKTSVVLLLCDCCDDGYLFHVSPFLLYEE